MKNDKLGNEKYWVNVNTFSYCAAITKYNPLIKKGTKGGYNTCGIIIHNNIIRVFALHENVYYENLCMNFKLFAPKQTSLNSIFHELLEAHLYFHSVLS